MIRTQGLTQIHLVVRDFDRSLRFYQEVFGMEERFRDGMARAKLGDERREQILSAFERCVIRDGTAKTSLQNVAKESDLPRSLARYFVGNREDMLDLLIDPMIERAEIRLDDPIRVDGFSLRRRVQRQDSERRRE